MQSLTRSAARTAEIRRDHEVIKAALVAELKQIFDAARLAPEIRLQDVWLNVHSATAANQDAARALESLRGTLLGNGSVKYSDSVPLPEALRWFRHRGNYHGVYGSLRELGNILRPALRIALGLTPEARIHVARTLHLRGELWTYEHDGQLHVFARPDSTVDKLLASERPRVVDPPPELPPKLRLVVTPAPALPSAREPDAPVRRSPSRSAALSAPR
jgi:hypothetical protein